MSSSVTCINCNRTVKKVESRPIVDVKDKIIGRACQACRNATIRLRCSALKCTTPLYKLKHLKSLPKSIDDLQTEPKKAFMENEFGRVVLISGLRCCAACYVRLHRLSRNQNNSTPQPLPPSNSAQTPVGHPPAAYETASKRT
ncbi:nuclear receptor corepressor 2 [Desmophyllum pertusum]|uniref:Nuclear receptor corepressor 2 n=1 Tax=Desmophyllum pertusum TaxID=174260 RepID=A0A9X0CK86_9CNID|nr:nuclear receptor corepressor 2 [Desmophyllum pertusum]KAJ7354957.1 nuclear receptor corepressor 2 [Desmophyllum pertusum]